jgi:hypothetical protein
MSQSTNRQAGDGWFGCVVVVGGGGGGAGGGKASQGKARLLARPPKYYVDFWLKKQRNSAGVSRQRDLVCLCK